MQSRRGADATMEDCNAHRTPKAITIACGVARPGSKRPACFSSKEASMEHPRTIHMAAGRFFAPLVGLFAAIVSCHPDQGSVTGVRHGLDAVIAPAVPQTATLSPTG